MQASRRVGVHGLSHADVARLRERLGAGRPVHVVADDVRRVAHGRFYVHLPHVDADAYGEFVFAHYALHLEGAQHRHVWPLERGKVAVAGVLDDRAAEAVLVALDDLGQEVIVLAPQCLVVVVG